MRSFCSGKRQRHEQRAAETPGIARTPQEAATAYGKCLVRC